MRTLRYSIGILIVAFGSLPFAAAQGPGAGMGMGIGSFPGFEGHEMEHNFVVPQVAVGDHYTTSVTLLNLGISQMMPWVSPQDLQTSGKIFFYHQDGTPLEVAVEGGGPVSEVAFSLEPGQTVTFTVTAAGQDASGWALIDIDPLPAGESWGMMDGRDMQGGMRLMANVFYTYSDGTRLVSRVGVLPSMFEAGNFFTSMMPVRSGAGIHTGVAVVNIGSNAAAVRVQLTDATGKVFAVRQIALGPGNQLAKFCFELFENMPEGFQGFLQIDTNDEGIVTMGLFENQGIMTSIDTLHYGRISMMP